MLLGALLPTPPQTRPMVWQVTLSIPPPAAHWPKTSSPSCSTTQPTQATSAASAGTPNAPSSKTSLNSYLASAIGASPPTSSPPMPSTAVCDPKTKPIPATIPCSSPTPLGKLLPTPPTHRPKVSPTPPIRNPLPQLGTSQLPLIPPQTSPPLLHRSSTKPKAPYQLATTTRATSPRPKPQRQPPLSYFSPLPIRCR